MLAKVSLSASIDHISYQRSLLLHVHYLIDCNLLSLQLNILFDCFPNSLTQLRPLLRVIVEVPAFNSRDESIRGFRSCCLSHE